MIITIGATKLSKKEWKTVTNVLFVYPLTIILMIIKWVVSGDKWLINTSSNSNNAKNKKTTIMLTRMNLFYNIEKLYGYAYFLL